MKTKPRIAWFSTLPSEDSEGSLAAYTSKLLLPFLRDRFEVDLYHDDFWEYQSYPTYHYLSAFERHQADPYSLFFYQIEDRPRSFFSRMHLALMPGVVLFHDYLYLNKGPIALATIHQDYDSPYAFREGRAAGIPVFTNPWAHREFLRLQGRKEQSSYYIPYPVQPNSFTTTSSDAVLLIGTSEVSDRVYKVFQALSSLSVEPTVHWLTDSKLRGQELIREYGLSNVQIQEGISPERWEQLLPFGRLAIHLHQSVYGSPGPYLPMSLMAGLTTVVMNFSATEDLSPQVGIQIEPGQNEAAQLEKVLRDFTRIPKHNPYARVFAEEVHSDRLVASELELLFLRSIEELRPIMDTWETNQKHHRATLFSESMNAFSEIPSFREKMREVYFNLHWKES